MTHRTEPLRAGRESCSCSRWLFWAACSRRPRGPRRARASPLRWIWVNTALLGTTEYFIAGRWDGTRWSGGYGFAGISGVDKLGPMTGSGPADVWFYLSQIYRWNGTTASPGPAWPVPRVTTRNPEKLWVGQPGDAWGIEAHEVRRFNGRDKFDVQWTAPGWLYDIEGVRP
jgi:hypothetical protein